MPSSDLLDGLLNKEFYIMLYYKILEALPTDAPMGLKKDRLKTTHGKEKVMKKQQLNRGRVSNLQTYSQSLAAEPRSWPASTDPFPS